MKTVSIEELRLITTCGAIVLTISTFFLPIKKESVMRLILRSFKKEFYYLKRISARKFYAGSNNIPTRNKSRSKREIYFALYQPFNMERIQKFFEQMLEENGYKIFHHFDAQDTYITHFGKEDSCFRFKIHMNRGYRVKDSIRIMIERTYHVQ